MVYCLMITTYDTLYARSSTGAILEWKMEQDGERYRTISGQADGQKITTEWCVAVPKNSGKANQTSGEEQATAEIKASYTKKLKQKYKETLADVDVKTFFQPMLAKKYNDYKDKINFFDGTWLAQTKFNGMRAVFTKDGAFSRTGEKVITVPHIEKDLEPFFAQNSDSVLDGEFFNYDLRQKLNELISLVRKTKTVTEQDLIDSEDKVRFYTYDMCIDTLGHSYKERKSIIDNDIIPLYPKYLRHVDDLILESEKQLMEFYQELVDDGQEGIILRKISSPYENKRSKNLLKLKPEDSSEAKIIAINRGTREWANGGKVITLEWDGKTFDATFKGTMEECEQFLIDSSLWIGRTVTFLYNGLTGYGVPNFARVDYNNCIKS